MNKSDKLTNIFEFYSLITVLNTYNHQKNDGKNLQG